MNEEMKKIIAVLKRNEKIIIVILLLVAFYFFASPYENCMRDISSGKESLVGSQDTCNHVTKW